MDLSAYREEHLRILKRAAELLAACERVGSSAALDETRSAVRRLDSILRHHLLREDDELYGRLMTSGDPDVRNIAAQALENMGGLAQAWVSFVELCEDARHPHDQSRMTTTCTALLKALTERVRWENEVLYPMAEALDPSGGQG